MCILLRQDTVWVVAQINVHSYLIQLDKKLNNEIKNCMDMNVFYQMMENEMK